VVKILVQNGDEVKKDEPLLVLEAMKMESEVKSPCDGTVSAVHVTAGDTVQTGDQLFTIA
jgi:pyruvate carboxylase subunit B